MIFKKNVLKSRNLRLPLFPKSRPIIKSRSSVFTTDYYLTEIWIIQSGFVYHLKSFPHQLLKQQIWVVFMWASHRFPGSILIFSNWRSPDFVLFKGIARCGQGQDKREQGEKMAGHGREPKSKHTNPTRLLSAPLGEELLTARLAQFSEKDYSNSLRKSNMQSTDF